MAKTDVVYRCAYYSFVSFSSNGLFYKQVLKHSHLPSAMFKFYDYNRFSMHFIMKVCYYFSCCFLLCAPPPSPPLPLKKIWFLLLRSARPEKEKSLHNYFFPETDLYGSYTAFKMNSCNLNTVFLLNLPANSHSLSFFFFLCVSNSLQLVHFLLSKFSIYSAPISRYQNETFSI